MIMIGDDDELAAFGFLNMADFLIWGLVFFYYLYQISILCLGFWGMDF